MFRTTLRGLLVRKLRLFTTSLAVLLGVAFMSGTLVLTDTIGRTFDNLFATVTAGTDAIVRTKAAIEGDFITQRERVPAAVLVTVARVDGVEAAEGEVEGYAQVVGKDGKVIGNPGHGAPTFGRNWPTVAALNPFRLVQGAAPGPGEVVIDRFTAKKGGYAVGDVATVLTTTGPVHSRIAGIATFGDADSALGATNVMFTLPDAQRVLGAPGRYDVVAVVARPGVSQQEVRDRIARAVPADTEVLTGAAFTKENQSAIRRSLGFFNTFLLIFAVVALLVGSFIIFNTFSIIVAQRGREMALLRAVGATRRQVLGSVLLEALAVGLLASLLGLFAGVGIAGLLKGLLKAFGVDIPAGGVVFSMRTVVASLVTGVGISTASAYFPARRASKVPPVAAMRALAVETRVGLRRRTIVGAVVTAAGGALLLGGLFGHQSNKAASVGFGAVVVFFGVAILGPVFARPVSRALGAPLPRLRGVPGRLARENAMRNPRRTASTAAALMIGVGLVGFITIFAASAKASLDDTIDKAFSGDFVIEAGSRGFGGLSPNLAASLRTMPEIRAVSGFRYGQARLGTGTVFVTAVDPGPFSEILDLDVAAGRLDNLGTGDLALLSSVAKRKGWHVGDTVTLHFARTGDRPFRVAAIFRRGDAGGQYLMSIAAYEANFSDQFDAQVLVAKSRTVTADQARRAITTVTVAYPNAKVEDQTEFKAAQAKQIDTLLGLIYVLLALAILIALMGIANTLALSIFERTHELGLLRAVGMTRPQLRTAVRYEAVIIALFGTLLGLTIGLFFGWSLVQALKSSGVTLLVVPAGQLVTVVVVAAFAGVVAAILPARRAARLDVLAAIAAD